MANNRNRKHVVARYIARKRIEVEQAPEVEKLPISGNPSMFFQVTREAKTPMARFSNHLDGVDEHRCQTCFIAYAEGRPLCDAGQALYDASH